MSILIIFNITKYYMDGASGASSILKKVNNLLISLITITLFSSIIQDFRVLISSDIFMGYPYAGTPTGSSPSPGGSPEPPKGPDGTGPSGGVRLCIIIAIAIAIEIEIVLYLKHNLNWILLKTIIQDRQEDLK